MGGYIEQVVEGGFCPAPTRVSTPRPLIHVCVPHDLEHDGGDARVAPPHLRWDERTGKRAVPCHNQAATQTLDNIGDKLGEGLVVGVVVPGEQLLTSGEDKADRLNCLPSDVFS